VTKSRDKIYTSTTKIKISVKQKATETGEALFQRCAKRKHH